MACPSTLSDCILLLQIPSLDGRADSSDGVFLRLMALHKGRVMLARALRLLYPSPEAEARSSGGGPLRSPPLRLAWALLRNVRVLFTPGGLRAAPGAGQAPLPTPATRSWRILLHPFCVHSLRNHPLMTPVTMV